MFDNGDERRDGRLQSPFVPIVLLASAIVVGLVWQTWHLVGERSQLAYAYATQEPATAQSKRLRSALDALAVTTHRLAAEGSVAARTVVDELAKRGVTITPTGAASAPK